MFVKAHLGWRHVFSCTGATAPHRPPTVPAFTCSCPAVTPCAVSTKLRAAHSPSVSVATCAHALFPRCSLFTEALLAPAPIQNRCVVGSWWVSSWGFWGSGKPFRRPARSPHAEGCGKLEWQERARHRQHFPLWSQDHLWGSSAPKTIRDERRQRHRGGHRSSGNVS